jgi:hypothetical protein
MIWFALFLILFIVTVVRVRQQGVPWDDVVATFSQWVHFIIMGGPWGPTFSSCIGLHVRDGHKYAPAWKAVEVFTDSLFWLKESDHCAESLYRVEQLERKRHGHKLYSE